VASEPGESGDRSPVRLFASASAGRRVLVHVVVATVVLVATALVVRRELRLLTDPVALRAFVDGFGPWAPAVLVVLQAAQVVAAPVPGQVLGVAGGYLFGPLWGAAYNLLGVTLGSALAFWLARRFGRPYVEGVVHEDLLARFDAVDDGRATLVLFVAFLVPGLPDDLLCLVGGLTTVPLWRLVVVAAVGRAPGFLLANALGDLLGTGRLGAALALGVVLAAASLAGYLLRDRLVGLLEA
jgi:uncharacterized membrane protein YdjX (TVP38/TMEM64 family)